MAPRSMDRSCYGVVVSLLDLEVRYDIEVCLFMEGETKIREDMEGMDKSAHTVL